MTAEEREYMKQLAEKTDNSTLCAAVLVLCDLDTKLERLEKRVRALGNTIGVKEAKE